MSDLACGCEGLTDGAVCAVCHDNRRIFYSNEILKFAQAAGFKIATHTHEIIERIELQRRYAHQCQRPPISEDERLAAAYVLNKYLFDGDCCDSLAEECGDAFVDDAKAARDKLIATPPGG